MLVLSREKGESIIIGDGTIEIVVLEVRGNKVRLGFKADRTIDINRQEIYLEKLAARRDKQPPSSE